MTRSRPACLGGHPTPPVRPSGGFGTRRRRWRLRAAGALTSGLAAILALAGCGLAEAESDEPERIAATTRALDASYDVEGAEAVIATYFGRLHWSAVEALAGAHYVNNANALGAELDRQAAEAAAAAERERQRQAASRPTATGGGGSGCGVPPDTGEPPPAGFPDYVVQAESGGSTTASNGSHFGRAQISCQHYGSNGGCVGMSYAQCWEKLWAGGAGGSNWEQTL